MSHLPAITRTLVATALATMGSAVLLISPVQADVAVGACTVISNPTPTNRTVCVGQNLSGQNFNGLDLRFANFTGSNLSGANFSGTNLSDGNLTGSNAAGAAFDGANLANANFTNANVAGSTIADSSVVPDDVTLVSTDGNPVAYALPATGNNLVRTCAPLGPFSVGSTSVTCTALIGLSGPSAAATFTVTVVLGVAPSITGPATSSVDVGMAFAYSPTTLTGSPAPVVTATGLPAGFTVAPATGAISGTPAAGSGGVYNVVLTAANGAPTPATLAVTLTITEPTSITGAPTASFTAGQGGSYSPGPVIGFPAPTFTATGLPAGLSINPATGQITGTPTAAGTFPIVITATNGRGAPASFPVSITVAPAAPAPAAPAPANPGAAPAAPAAPGAGGGTGMAPSAPSDNSSDEAESGGDASSDVPASSVTSGDNPLPDTGGASLGFLVAGLTLTAGGALAVGGSRLGRRREPAQPA